MKKFVVLFACTFAVLAPYSADASITTSVMQAFSKTQQQLRECLSTVGMSKSDQIADILNSREPEGTPENIRKSSCLLACLLQYHGSMNGAKLNMEKLHEVVQLHANYIKTPIQEYHLLVDNCANEVTEVQDQCDVARKFGQCVIYELRQKKKTEHPEDGSDIPVHEHLHTTTVASNAV